MLSGKFILCSTFCKKAWSIRSYAFFWSQKRMVSVSSDVSHSSIKVATNWMMSPILLPVRKAA